jgi:hypothetical protein
MQSWWRVTKNIICMCTVLKVPVFWGKIFFLLVFGGLEAHFIFCFLCRASEVNNHPRWQPISGLAVYCRLGRLPDSNLRLQVFNLVSLPMSPHYSMWKDDRHFLSGDFSPRGDEWQACRVVLDRTPPPPNPPATPPPALPMRWRGRGGGG